MSRKEVFITVDCLSYEIDNLPQAFKNMITLVPEVWFVSRDGFCRQVRNWNSPVDKVAKCITSLFETNIEMLTHEDPVVRQWGLKALKESE